MAGGLLSGTLASAFASLAVFSAPAAPPLHGALQASTAPLSEQSAAGVAQYQCRGTDGYAQSFGGRRTYLWRPQWLIDIKAQPAVHAEVIAEANKALKRGPYSVTDKTKLVPGATLNDYISIGPYWWPDPGKASGLPYVQRDGEVNPESRTNAFDKARMEALGKDAKALSLAYYITDDRRYAVHAAAMLRHWFIEPKTRMNPNMNFAQGIPGKVYGRGIGIIEAAQLSTVIEALGLLAPSGALSDAEHTVIQQWYRDMAVWLATSENGIDELKKANNHGVFYDFYLAHFALYVGLESVTLNIADAFPEARLGPQMDRQGRFLEELKRTRSWHYSHYVMEGAGKLATIAECVDKDMWQAALPDGRNLMTGQAFLEKYWQSDLEWPFGDIDLPKKTDRLTDFKSVLRVHKLFAYAASQSVQDNRDYRDNLISTLP